MVICVTPEDIADRPKVVYGKGYGQQIIGDRKVPTDGPLAHVVRQGAHDVTPPHFHEVSQFQVFSQGNGLLGRHPILAGLVHYTDGYTPYGPIAAGDQGCTYYTLRAMFDVSHHMVPEKIELAKGRRGRQMTAQINMNRVSGEGASVLFERDDGTAAHRVAAEPGVQLPSVPSRGGCYWLILSGGLICEDRGCDVESCIWVGENEHRPPMTSGPVGVIAAVLCFAPKSRAQSTN